MHDILGVKQAEDQILSGNVKPCKSEVPRFSLEYKLRYVLKHDGANGSTWADNYYANNAYKAKLDEIVKDTVTGSSFQTNMDNQKKAGGCLHEYPFGGDFDTVFGINRCILQKRVI